MYEEFGIINSILTSCPICDGMYIKTGYGEMSNRTLITLQYVQVTVQVPYGHYMNVVHGVENILKIIKYSHYTFYVNGSKFDTDVLLHLSECAGFLLEYFGFLASSRKYSSIERSGELAGQAMFPTQDHACGKFVSQAYNSCTWCVFGATALLQSWLGTEDLSIHS
jgi:hypothetical protein